MKILMRVAFEDGSIYEFDPDVIQSFRITEIEDNSSEFMLTVATGVQECVLHTGTAAECKAILNKIHNKLDIHTVDL